AQELFGRADVRRLAVVVAGEVVGKGPVNVLAHVEIGKAVAVQVGPRGASRPGNSLVQAGAGADVLEPPTALPVGYVPEKGAAAPTRDEQVRPTVAVIIGDRRGVAVEPGLSAGQALQADLGGDVLELPVAEVLVELARMALDLLLVGAVEIAAAGQEQVE